MKIIFHKISKKYPNTIKGFEDSITQGYNKFELDIRKCKDTYILYHDQIKNGKYVSQENLSDLDCIDTLRDFLIISSQFSGLEIFFDIKGTDISIVDFFKNNSKFLNHKNKYHFQSFNLQIIELIKATNSQNICGLLIAGYIPINNQIINSIDYISIEEEFIDKYLCYHIDKYIWTVNSTLKYKYYEEIGVKGIITDYPDIFK
jgi:glycerophosphoryl diester phosphodiesterase